MKIMDQQYHTAINWLDRKELVEILEQHGFACYDTESTDDLREALRANVLDGTIPRSVLDTRRADLDVDKTIRRALR